MIFGFNTDVQSGDTVYHVQSEVRERELRLQTQVFVSGHCVAKRTTSCAEAEVMCGFSSDDMHDLLRAQHRDVIELVRAGEVAKVPLPDVEAENHLAMPAESAGLPDAPESAQSLALTWLNTADFDAGINDQLQLRFRIARAGAGVGNARVIVRMNGSASPPQYGEAVTTSDGCVLVTVPFNSAAHGDVVAMLVQAMTPECSIMRKFHLRRAT